MCCVRVIDWYTFTAGRPQVQVVAFPLHGTDSIRVRLCSSLNERHGSTGKQDLPECIAPVLLSVGKMLDQRNCLLSVGKMLDQRNCLLSGGKMNYSSCLT